MCDKEHSLFSSTQDIVRLVQKNLRVSCSVHLYSALFAVTEYSLSEHKQATVALRQLEECGVPCECPRCKSAYHRLMSIQRQMEERELLFVRPSRHYVQYD